MKVLKSGKNAGNAVYYFQIGFQCAGYFNNVIETADENSVENLVEEVEKEYGEIPVVRKIRTNGRKIICVK